MLTNIVRAFCALVDVGVVALAVGAAVRFHRRGIERVRAAGRPAAEPRSNVVPLQRGRV